MITIAEAGDKIFRALAPLPPGFGMSVSMLTDNIIVEGPQLGFAVTRARIYDNLYMEQAKWAFARLKKLEGVNEPAPPQ